MLDRPVDGLIIHSILSVSGGIGAKPGTFAHRSV